MKLLRLLLAMLAIPLFAFTSMHKYYISVTQIDYIQEKRSVQIISRIFIDDLENLLRKRYDENITLAEHNEAEDINLYIERYLSAKMKFKINGFPVKFNYIGKTYDADVAKCYLEIENIENIKSLEISNQVLFDLFEDQQNIVKTKINTKQKSFILTEQNANVVLNFN